MECTPKDVDRLISNQSNLLKTIPEMVLLVKDSISVEYMNPSARTFFGNLTRVRNDLTSEETSILESVLAIISTSQQKNNIGSTLETQINQFHLEYTLAPFQGYKGDSLYWLFIRDLTDKKKQMDELSLFHNSIETILSHKISELKESERTRRKLANELNSLKEHLQEVPNEGKMVGSSRALSELRDMVFQVAKSDGHLMV